MLAPGDIERIANVCATVSNEVADETGFVPIRGLLGKFQAGLTIRPLLVEGMVSSVESPISGGGERKWMVLVDSETYDVSERDVELEDSDHPLSTRFRNTVAHELVHLIALAPATFGIRLRGSISEDQSGAEMVRSIEAQTERLSPLLLFSWKALEKHIKTRRTPMQLDDFARLCSSLGLSKHVMVNRLRLVGPDDDSRLRLGAGLRNLAVGLAQWTPQGIALLRNWPLFINFDRNIVPAFLTRLATQDSLNPLTIFDQRSFAMCGGKEQSIDVTVHAGTPASPNLETMKVRITVDEGSRNPGMESLYTVHKLSDHQHHAQ